MRIELENVGKIGKARIELEGITVIAGENSTGKSTVGKMLFSVFQAFYRIEEYIRTERANTIYKELSKGILVPPKGSVLQVLMGRIFHMLDHMDEYRGNEQKITEEFAGIYGELFSHPLNKTVGRNMAEAAKRVNQYLNMEDEELIQFILKRSLEAEFGEKIGHLNFPKEKSSVSIKIKDQAIDFDVRKDGRIDIRHFISLMKEIVYIDDPFVLDNLYRTKYQTFDTLTHRSDLQRKLAKGKAEKELGILEELAIQKKMQTVLDAVNGICNGGIEIKPYGEYVYKSDDLQDELEIVNLSTGMKNFVILKQLLQNGSIDENGIIILDEPEIHLHPEWQLKFAEIIVLMQIEFGIHVLLNTHSPYFMNAIEVYTNKYGIGDKCRYYLTDEKDGRVEMEDVSHHVERIYAKLARPLQDLENMEYNIEDTL